LTSIHQLSISKRASRRLIGPVLLVSALVAGCSSGTSPNPSPSSSAGVGASTSSSLRQCLKKHGVTLPAHRPTGNGGYPPAGGFGGGFGGGGAGGSSTFRKALQACGGSLPGGGRPAG
jgi:hypothetical protein